jgi:hypothetical protein
MKINYYSKVFKDNTSWEKFIPSSKEFQEGITLEKVTKTTKFAFELLAHAHEST